MSQLELMTVRSSKVGSVAVAGGEVYLRIRQRRDGTNRRTIEFL